MAPCFFFNRNKECYQESKYFFVWEGDVLKKFKLTAGQIDRQFKHAPKVYLWMERGALLHTKSLNTDKAWEIYDHLVETYFRVQQEKFPARELFCGTAFLLCHMDITLKCCKLPLK